MVDRLTGLAQRVGSVDDRCDLSALDQLRQNNQVLLLRRHDEGRQALAHERKRHLRADKTTPAMGTAAACSKGRLAGFGASAPSDTAAYSAKAPPSRFAEPKTASPGRNRVPLEPTASTCPATSVPRTRFFGLRSPYIGRAMYGRPAMIAQSPGLTPAARTRTSTSSSPISGWAMSRRSSTSEVPYVS